MLLIEVADNSLDQDLTEKAQLFSQHGIPEYWVVDIQHEQVHIHRSPTSGNYDSRLPFAKTESVSPSCQAAVVLSLANLFDLD